MRSELPQLIWFFLLLNANESFKRILAAWAWLQAQREATFLRERLVKPGGGENWLRFMSSLNLDCAGASAETLAWRQHAAGN